jgi:hypothetical protein
MISVDELVTNGRRREPQLVNDNSKANGIKHKRLERSESKPSHEILALGWNQEALGDIVRRG